ncbi:hypothetical protein ACIQYW_06795 [Rhodococcus erythropolis]|uniref:Uncharacterized protein n=1 Tax=Rhodococcus baikonurensis TaxID=172041 RepID=A0ABV5XIN9_9NOCA|nr:hypothetical protein D4768_22535 [Rhodococcus erythropolis]
MAAEERHGLSRSRYFWRTTCACSASPSSSTQPLLCA